MILSENVGIHQDNHRRSYVLLSQRTSQIENGSGKMFQGRSEQMSSYYRIIVRKISPNLPLTYMTRDNLTMKIVRSSQIMEVRLYI